VAACPKAPSAKKHGACGKSEGREWIGLTSPSKEKSIQRKPCSGRLHLEKGWKLRKSFTSQTEANRWLKAGKDESPSDSNSSSLSSEPDSSSSDSDSLTDEHGKQTKRKKKKKKKKKDKCKTSYCGLDPTVGDSKQIHDVKLTDAMIDKDLTPGEDVSRKEWGAILKSAVNMTALPGMCSASSTTSDEVQGVTEAATLTLATLAGKRAQLHDSQWKTTHKNLIGNVRKASDLFKMLKNIADSKDAAFKQQDDNIRTFLHL
jgi:hypothetical protein